MLLVSYELIEYKFFGSFVW